MRPTCVRPDFLNSHHNSVDSIFGYRFDFDFIGYSVFFQISDQSVPVQIPKISVTVKFIIIMCTCDITQTRADEGAEE